MIALDEDALVCDLAETYHIYNMRDFPCAYVATLANGLRENSRIKLKAGGLRVDVNTLLLAHIADNTAINVYAKTKDAKTGRNMPKSFVTALTKDPNKELRKFATGDDFMKEWRRINGNRTR